MKMVTLHCAAGNHSWERQSQRGRPPYNCKEHSEITATVITPNETMTDDDEEFLLEREISLVATVTGADRAARLFENMKMLNSKTNRQVIMR